mmetsp:Transcript_1217/g.3727  ORF Transcript_1217/g.3727 Transcript_1217/m.3727 type:complete len:206 (-) Transcript_1217:145-762(-)
MDAAARPLGRARVHRLRRHLCQGDLGQPLVQRAATCLPAGGGRLGLPQLLRLAGHRLVPIGRQRQLHAVRGERSEPSHERMQRLRLLPEGRQAGARRPAGHVLRALQRPAAELHGHAGPQQVHREVGGARPGGGRHHSPPLDPCRAQDLRAPGRRSGAHCLGGQRLGGRGGARQSGGHRQVEPGAAGGCGGSVPRRGPRAEALAG